MVKIMNQVERHSNAPASVLARVVTALIAGSAWLCASAAVVHAQPALTTPRLSGLEAGLIGPEPRPGDFLVTSPAGTNFGAFHFTSEALVEAGFLNPDGTWSFLAKSMGISSLRDFLRTTSAQVVAEDKLIGIALSNVRLALGETNYRALAGRQDRSSGAQLTDSAMAYCSLSLGAGGCASYLTTGSLPDAVLDAHPSFANGQWQKQLVAMAQQSMPPVLEQGPPSKAFSGGWQSMRRMDAFRPTAEQKSAADLWLQYGGKAGPYGVAFPVIYAEFTLGTAKVLAGIGLVEGCELVQGSDVTQLHVPCPVSVITSRGGTVSSRTYSGTCYMWTADMPPSAQTNPDKNATLMHMDEKTGQLDIMTIRDGKPIAECAKRISYE